MTDITQCIKILQRIPQFNDLLDEAKQDLAASAVRRQFCAGQVIYVEGEPADPMIAYSIAFGVLLLAGLLLITICFLVGFTFG